MSTPRLHRSTWVFVTLLAMVLALMNAPGQVVYVTNVLGGGKYGPHFENFDAQCEHGWPLTWLRRSGVSVGGRWRLSPWYVWEGVEGFSSLALAANAVVAGGVLLASGAVFELWRRRRVLQLHLIDLLAFVVVFSLAARPVIVRIAAHEREHRIWLTLSAYPERTEEHVQSSYAADWQPGGPSWLRELVGGGPFRAFDRAVAVTTSEVGCSAQIVELRTLKTVRFWGGGPSNRQLELLEQLPQLEALDLFMSGPGGEDRGLRMEGDLASFPGPWYRLPRLPRLRALNLCESEFRGEGLENLPAIEVLDLSSTDVDDAALEKLRGAGHLKDLSLYGTSITDDGLRHLAGLKELKDLWLDETAVTDAGVIHLAGLGQLRMLSLRGTQVTDASIPVLRRLVGLKCLDVDETAITEAGRQQLRQALPECSIY